MNFFSKRAAEHDDTHRIAKTLTDSGSPLPNAGEGPGVRGQARSSMLSRVFHKPPEAITDRTAAELYPPHPQPLSRVGERGTEHFLGELAKPAHNSHTEEPPYETPWHTGRSTDPNRGNLRGSPSAAKPVSTGHSNWRRRSCPTPCGLWRARAHRASGYAGCPGQEPGQENSSGTSERRIALIGQPNCGKSTLFNSVAGYRAVTSNFPGVTVHYIRSRIQLNDQTAELIDLPGTYSLTAFTPAESATRDFLLDGGTDAVINVIDASVLSRSLELTLQLLELGMPVVVCLNMMDEAHRKGIHIDSAALACELGVPVVETVAAEGVGIHSLFQRVLEAAKEPAVQHLGPRYHLDTETAIDNLSAWLAPSLTDRNCLPPRLLAIKLLEGDEHLLSLASASTQERTTVARQQLREARGRAADEVIESERHALSMQL